MNDTIRKAAVMGGFYPETCSEVRQYFQKFDQRYNALDTLDEMAHIMPRAVIVPHAGYVYSGFTANIAYRFLKKSKAKRIIVIGPSHHHYFKGISGSYYEKYETPCGELEIDSPYLFALAKQFNIGFEPKAHQKEHSTEVQFPFIQHYFSKAKVIELIYGEIGTETLANIISALLQNRDNALIISSDLSHFHSLKEANELDKHCVKGVEDLNIKELEKGCKACGRRGIQAMILAAKHLKLSSKLLDYRTSAVASHDTSSVVGYMSAIFY